MKNSQNPFEIFAPRKPDIVQIALKVSVGAFFSLFLKNFISIDVWRRKLGEIFKLLVLFHMNNTQNACEIFLQYELHIV